MSKILVKAFGTGFQKSKLIVILGPTGSGKTDLAIKLAKKFNGEIISADSRQIYKEMFVGTASPCRQTSNIKSKIDSILINKIPHYLLHIIKPDQKFNVALYKKLAIKIIKNIQKRGKLPILCGGAGLYIRAVRDNIEFPQVPPQKKLRKELENKTTEELFKIYQKLDPEGAKFIDKKNKRRLARAIEVCKTTGKPFWQQRKKGKSLFNVLEIGLKISKKELKKRISQRVEKMLKSGLEKEVKGLVKKYGWPASLQTIGYREWKDYFQGKISKEKVKELIIQRSFQFVSRQTVWFKKYCPETSWIKTEKQAEKLIKKFLN